MSGRIVTHRAVRERLTNHLNNKGILRSQLRRRFQLLRAKQGVKLGNPTNLESKEYNQLCYVLLGSLYIRGNTKRKRLRKNSKKFLISLHFSLNPHLLLSKFVLPPFSILIYVV